MLTERLARFVIETPDTQIPSPVLAGAREALLDTVGVALAGTVEPVGEIVARYITDLGARPQATFWGQRSATSPADAAFANGVCAHALDFDDSLPSLRGHPSATMIPAALATGETSKASGRDVLAAYALGLDIAGKLGHAIGHGHYLRGWHTTATVGIFSSTAVAARLAGLSVQQLRAAWGLAASQTAGLIRNFGTMAKPYHAGHAARCAVQSVLLARAGFTTNESIFDGENSVIAVYRGDDGAPLGELLERLGAPWEMLEPGIYVKRWPCCYCNHRPVGGLLELMAKHGIRADEVQQVEVGFLPGTDNALVSEDPQTGLEGKFSIEYAMAATLLDGKLTLESFTDAMVQRPAVRDLMRKVRRYRIADDKVYSGVVGYTDIAVDTVRGRFAMRIDRAPGSPQWPMSAQERIEKFMDCAGRVLGTPGAKRLLERVENCERLADIRELTSATLPAARKDEAEAQPEPVPH